LRHAPAPLKTVERMVELQTGSEILAGLLILLEFCNIES
jgi:hypothetical protein